MQECRLAEPPYSTPLAGLPQFLEVTEHGWTKLNLAKACLPDSALDLLLKDLPFRKQHLLSVWKVAYVALLSKRKPARDLMNISEAMHFKDR